MIGRREELRALEVVVERGAERLVGGGVAELLDPQVRVRLLRRRGGRERGVDDLVAALLGVREAERDQRGAAVLGDLALVALGQRGLDVLDVLGLLEPGDDVVDPGLDGGIIEVQLAVAGLDEHLLVGLVREVRVVDRGVGDARLAVAGVLVGERVGADRAAEDEGGDHEGEPAADRDLAVLRAPISGARSEVSLGHLWPPGPGERHVVWRLPSGRRHVIRARRPVGLRRPTECAVGLAIAAARYSRKISSRMMMISSSVPIPMYMAGALPLVVRCYSRPLSRRSRPRAVPPLPGHPRPS